MSSRRPQTVFTWVTADTCTADVWGLPVCGVYFGQCFKQVTNPGVLLFMHVMASSHINPNGNHGHRKSIHLYDTDPKIYQLACKPRV